MSGLEIPAIDERSEVELFRQCQQVVLDRSRGQLNDFSDSEPLGVLLRAQAFAGAELLYAANKLPLVVLLKLLELTGVKRIESSNAQATVTVALSAPRSIPFSIPRGTRFVTIDGAVIFESDRLEIIPAGAQSIDVPVTAIDSGTQGNVAAYTITRLQQPLSFVSNVVNAQPAQGGSDGETVDAAIQRGISALRSRAPISAIDYELAAQSVLGVGSRCKAIGLLDANFVKGVLGVVHLFCLAPDGTPANQNLLNDVSIALTPRIMLGTTLIVSPMGTLPLAADVVVKASTGVDLDALADRLFAVFSGYVSQEAYEPGDAALIDELRFQMRSVTGVERIDELRLNGGTVDIPMPNEWTIPRASSLAVTVLDEDGRLIQSTRGSGEPEDFNP